MGRKSKAVSRKKEILHAYYAIMKTKGLEGITVANIAEQMQVNPSLIIHYFGTKEAIDNAFVYEIVENLKQMIPCKEVEQFPPELRLQKFLEWIITPMEDSDILFGLYELSNRNKSLKPLLEELLKGYETFICREIDYAISQDLIKKQLREIAIWLLLASLHHVRNDYFIFGKRPNDDLINNIYALFKRKNGK